MEKDSEAGLFPAPAVQGHSPETLVDRFLDAHSQVPSSLPAFAVFPGPPE